MVFETQRQHIKDFGVFNIQYRDRIVFLQGDPGAGAVDRNGNVFWLEVLGCGRARPKDTNTGLTQGLFATIEGTEIRGLHGGIHNAVGQVDDTDRAFRVRGVVGTGLPFVGYQHFFAIAGEGHHVWQGSDNHLSRFGQIRSVVKHYFAASLFHLRFDSHSNQFTVHGHTVGRGAFASGIDGVHPYRRRRIPDIQHINRRRIGVDHKQALVDGIVRHNFGCAFIENLAFRLIGTKPIQLDDRLQCRNSLCECGVTGSAGTEPQGGCQYGGSKEGAIHVHVYLWVVST